MSHRPEVTVVVPLFNELENLPTLLAAVEQTLAQVDYELLLVDDASNDGSTEWLQGLVQPRVGVLRLLRRGGQNAALLAGIEAARGCYILSLDADLEYPPESLLRFLAPLRAGVEVVNGRRRQRAGWIRRWAELCAVCLAGKRLHDPFCPIKGASSKLKDELLASGSLTAFVGLALLRCGRTVEEVELTRGPRRRGSSRYSLARLSVLLLELTLLTLTGWARKPRRQSRWLKVPVWRLATRGRQA